MAVWIFFPWAEGLEVGGWGVRIEASRARSLRVRSVYCSGGNLRARWWRRCWRAVVSLPDLLVVVVPVRIEVPARLVSALLVPLLEVLALLAASVWDLVYMAARGLLMLSFLE